METFPRARSTSDKLAQLCHRTEHDTASTCNITRQTALEFETSALLSQYCQSNMSLWTLLTDC